MGFTLSVHVGTRWHMRAIWPCSQVLTSLTLSTPTFVPATLQITDIRPEQNPSLAMVDYPYPCGFMSVLPANPVAEACKLFRADG